MLRLLCNLLDSLLDPFRYIWTIIQIIFRPNSLIRTNTFYHDGDLVIHERQSLQLCAIHTVNNLLQLTSRDTRAAWVCGDYRMELKQDEKKPCTKTEMDEIADDLAVAEQALFSNSNHVDDLEVGLTTSRRRKRRKPSWWRKFCSNHRTLLFGNYSFETMQVALKVRNVELQWYTPKGDITKSPDGIVIGFVINAVEPAEEPSCSNSPMFAQCCERGRHWFAISRIRRIPDETERGRGGRWKVLDSDREDVPFLSDLETLDYLHKTASEEGTIFRAILKVK